MQNKLFMTCGISNKIEESKDFAKTVKLCLDRYTVKDWGDLCEDDKQMNTQAIESGGRILASYKTEEGKVYIITDEVHTSPQITTILFANEY